MNQLEQQRLQKQKEYFKEIQFYIEDEIQEMKTFNNIKNSQYHIIMWELMKMSENCNTLCKITDIILENDN